MWEWSANLLYHMGKIQGLLQIWQPLLVKFGSHCWCGLAVIAGVVWWCLPWCCGGVCLGAVVVTGVCLGAVVVTACMLWWCLAALLWIGAWLHCCGSIEGPHSTNLHFKPLLHVHMFYNCCLHNTTAVYTRLLLSCYRLGIILC